jgi:hypothetical protein
MIIIKIITIISTVKVLIEIDIVDYIKAWQILSGFFGLSGLLATRRAPGPVCDIVSPDRTMSQPSLNCLMHLLLY